MWKKITFLLAISSAVQSNELDNLIDSSSAIVDQMSKGVRLTGAAMGYAHTGTGLSDGTLSSTAHISQAQVDAYNSALSNMSNYQPYGAPVKEVLESMAMDSLDQMDTAIDTLMEVVVDMSTAQQVAEMAEEAQGNPQQEEEVQTFVAENQEMLKIDQEDADKFNQAVDDIESSANEASAYLAVANSEAADFLQQSIEDKNTTSADVNIFYDANNQWVAMGYNTTRNLTAVMLNGSDYFSMDLYYSEADILALGTESEFYQTSPIAMGYNCFFNMECE
jgi:hypothetical protein